MQSPGRLLSPSMGAVSWILNKVLMARQACLMCFGLCPPAFSLREPPGCWQHNREAAEYHRIHLHYSLLASCAVACTSYLLLLPQAACYCLGWMWARFQILPFLLPFCLFKIQLYPAHIAGLTYRARNSQLHSLAPFFPVSLTHFSSEAVVSGAQYGNRAPPVPVRKLSALCHQSCKEFKCQLHQIRKRMTWTISVCSESQLLHNSVFKSLTRFDQTSN